MDRPPYPGPNGEEIFNNVSKEAWLEWLALQTMLINEKQLSLADSSSRKYLNEQLEKFLYKNLTDQPEGFSPQKD